MKGVRGLFWPLLLIVVGAVALLANYGLIANVSWWSILQLWPLLLVVIGVDVALGRQWPLAALAIDLVVLAAGVALVITQPFPAPSWWFGPRFDGGPGSTSVNAPRDGASSLSLHVSGGGGTLRLHGGATALVEASSPDPVLRVARSQRIGDRADVRVEQTGPMGPNGSVDVAVPNDLPLSLDLAFGAGDFTVDLRDTRLTDLRLSSGASSLRVLLPKPSGDVRVRVSSGASSVALELPAGAEASLSWSGGMMSFDIETPWLSQHGGGLAAGNRSARSSGYAAAADRLTISISSGAGSLSVR